LHLWEKWHLAGWQRYLERPQVVEVEDNFSSEGQQPLEDVTNG
jgi:hypothetical protein